MQRPIYVETGHLFSMTKKNRIYAAFAGSLDYLGGIGSIHGQNRAPLALPEESRICPSAIQWHINGGAISSFGSKKHFRKCSKKTAF